jgi:hypothetical protein
VVAGGRTFDNYDLLKEKLQMMLFTNYKSEEIEIVSGAANGADKLGERFAEEFGCHIKRFPAEWDKYGRSAGYRRNADMAKYGNCCVCFWDGQSKGTKHMIDLAKKAKIKLKVVRY